MAEKQTQGNGPDDKAAREPAPTKDAPKTGTRSADAPKEGGSRKDVREVEKSVAEVQANKDVEDEQGYRGARVDPTPLEHYTVEGVTSGKPTPETDEDARLAALERRQTPVERLGEDKED